MEHKFGKVTVVLAYGTPPGTYRITWPIDLDRETPERLLKSLLINFSIYSRDGNLITNKKNLYGAFFDRFWPNSIDSIYQEILSPGKLKKSKVSSLDAIVIHNEDNGLERFLAHNKNKIKKLVKQYGIKFK